MSRPLVRTLLLLPALGAPATAQILDGWQSRIPLPTEVSATNGLGVAAVGEFTADQRCDVCQVVGGRPWIIAGPDTYRQLVSLTTASSTTDVATLIASGPCGTDVLMMTSSRGLEAWHLNSARDGFNVTLISNSADWQSAKSLQCVDLDGDGDQDIMALKSNGLAIVRMTRSGTTFGSLSFTSATSLTLSSAAHSIVAGQWQSSTPNTAEVAVLTGTAVTVHAMTSSTLGSNLITCPTATGTTPTALRRIAFTGGDGLLWIAKNSTTNQDELRAMRSTQVWDSMVDLGSIKTTGVATGDLDADGDDDLVLIGTSSADLRLYSNTPSLTECFGTTAGRMVASPIDYDPLLPMLNQAARPLMADFDNDGDLDFYSGIQGSAGGYIVNRNFVVPESLGRINLTGAVIGVGGEIELTVEPTDVMDFNPTHVEVAIFPVVDDERLSTPWCEFEIAIDSRNPWESFENLEPRCEAPDCSEPPITGSSPPDRVGCEYQILLRAVRRNTTYGHNEWVGPDTSARYHELGNDSGSQPLLPLPNLGPAPVGTLPPPPQLPCPP